MTALFKLVVCAMSQEVGIDLLIAVTVVCAFCKHIVLFFHFYLYSKKLRQNIKLVTVILEPLEMLFLHIFIMLASIGCFLVDKNLSQLVA